MIKTAQDAYLAGRQAGLEKLAYDWLGDSGLSLGGLSEYKNTSDPAKVRRLQRNLESLTRDRAKVIEDWRSNHGEDGFKHDPLGIDTLYYATKNNPKRYTGVDPARDGIASYSTTHTVPQGVKRLLRISRRAAEGAWSDHEAHIQRLKEIHKYTGGRQAALDLLELEPRLGVAPVTVDILAHLNESELYDSEDIPALAEKIKLISQGDYGLKREREIKNLVKKLKATKSNKINLNEELESEKARGYKTYLTPQNINRLAILGGTAGGAYLGDFTPRAFGVSLGGSVVGNLLGGAAGSGINAFRGGKQSNLVPLIGSTTGAIGGGLAAGKYLA